MARKRNGGNRLVIQLSDENYLAVYAELTPEGETKPPFGALSKFFNALTDDWRTKRAIQKEPSK